MLSNLNTPYTGDSQKGPRVTSHIKKFLIEKVLSLHGNQKKAGALKWGRGFGVWKTPILGGNIILFSYVSVREEIDINKTFLQNPI